MYNSPTDRMKCLDYLFLMYFYTTLEWNVGVYTIDDQTNKRQYTVKFI
jgi:hypothetical protein